MGLFLEKELEKIHVGNQGIARTVLKPINDNCDTVQNTANQCSASSTFTDPQPAFVPKPLDQKEQDLSENVQILNTQISSAEEHLKYLRTTNDNLTRLGAVRGRLCNKCHTPDHTKASCKSASQCTDYRKWEIK